MPNSQHYNQSFFHAQSLANGPQAPSNSMAQTAHNLEDLWMGEGLETLLDAVPDPDRFYIAITQIAIKRKTAGGVLLPDQAIDDQQWTSGLAIVVKVGPSCFKGRRFEDIGLDETQVPKPGDIVHFNAGASPRRIHVDGRLFLFITDDSIISRPNRKHLHRLKFTV